MIGHDVWQTRFASDPAIVGRSVRLGTTEHTVVGVMPAGFAFPVAHNLWVPFRADPLAHARRQGPEIQLFGRLAPGATLAEAQAELTTLGTRAAAEFRDTHERLRPQVLPYARSVVDVSGLHALALASANVPVVLLLVLVFANVALLTFARAATRESEIVVRSALGASRGRITMQLFAEALVLGGLAAVAGLAAAGAGLRWVMRIVEGEILRGGKLPFWFDDRLSPATLLYDAALTLLGAVIAGVVPALKVTRGLATRLKQATAGGGGLQFGGLWTAVIVAQVAVTVAFPVTAYVTRLDAVQIRSLDVGFEDAQYLSVRLEMDREPGPGAGADTSRAAFEARFRRTYAELERRLLADPAVLGVAFADRLPRMYHPHRLVEVDDGGAAPLDPRWPAYRVSSASVDRDFFDVLGTPIRAGRGFHAADLAADARAVVVNQSFVDNVLGGRNPIGRRVRYVAKEEAEPRKLKEPSAWYEIVGVVQDLGLSADRDPKVAGFYHPVAEGGAYPAQLAVHVAGRANAFVPRMRAVAAATDPTLRLYALTPIAAINEAELEFLDFWFRILLGVSAVAMTLSLAGIYAVMSFTVARRTREIGIRVALGANRRRVVAAVFRRPLAQVATGIVAGGSLLAVTVLVGALLSSGNGKALSLVQLGSIAAYAAGMLFVCLFACVVPTRRALRVEPTEALRADG